MANVVFLVVCVTILVCVSASCKKNILESRFNKNERFLIVKTHNKLRMSLVKGLVKEQPRAFKMNRLRWDPYLAKQAQKIADRCKMKHARVKDTRWAVGQNLFQHSSTAYRKGLNVTGAVFSWFNEHRLYKYPLYKPESGHYTQVVWADTKYVGCGYAHFKVPKGKFKYNKLLVCNYGPAGNVKGRPPYKRRP